MSVLRIHLTRGGFMVLWSRLAAVVALIVLAQGAVGAEKAPATTKGAEKVEALTVTLKEDGKTVKAGVGQEVVVSLEGKEAGTGWEVSKAEGKSVVPVKEGGSVSDQKTPPMEFTPTEGASDKAIGTYTWRYKAVAEGKTTLTFVYVSPGGPEPIQRSATRLARRMKVTIEVGK